MIPPVPSRFRSLRVFAERAAARSKGKVLHRWPEKHPLGDAYWWLIANEFCDDAGDVLLAPGYSILEGDGALTITGWTLASDQKSAGLFLSGGTPGVIYQIRARLTLTQSPQRWAGDILLTVDALAEIPTPNPSYLTVGGDIALLTGIPFPSGA